MAEACYVLLSFLANLAKACIVLLGARKLVATLRLELAVHYVKTALSSTNLFAHEVAQCIYQIPLIPSIGSSCLLPDIRVLTYNLSGVPLALEVPLLTFGHLYLLATIDVGCLIDVMCAHLLVVKGA